MGKVPSSSYSNGSFSWLHTEGYTYAGTNLDDAVSAYEKLSIQG